MGRGLTWVVVFLELRPVRSNAAIELILSATKVVVIVSFDEIARRKVDLKNKGGTYDRSKLYGRCLSKINVVGKVRPLSKYNLLKTGFMISQGSLYGWMF